MSRKTKMTMLAGALLTIITVMLMLGSTMAWFHDNEVVINTYTFGDLDVDIVNGGGTVIGGTTLQFVTPTGGEYAEGAYLFEPGATFQLKDFYIRNSGDVDLNYRLQLDDSAAEKTGGGDLLEAMDIYATIGGEPLDLAHDVRSLAVGQTSEAVRIYFHMKEAAGNEYQDLAVTKLIVKVIAVQREGIPASEVEDAFNEAARTSAPTP